MSEKMLPTHWEFAAQVYHDLVTENAVLAARLEQIEAVCADNASDDCNHRMALDFVRQIVKREA